MSDEQPDTAHSQDERPPPDETRRKEMTRRALVRAGWSVPIVLATARLPKNLFAQYAHADGTPHSDGAYYDSSHADHQDGGYHNDGPCIHVDTAPSGYIDVPHQDILHADVPHGDLAHTDSPQHIDEYTDVSHQDFVHGDFYIDNFVYGDHTDTGFGSPHLDQHWDADFYTDTGWGTPHLDGPVVNIPHEDTYLVPHGDECYG